MGHLLGQGDPSTQSAGHAKFPRAPYSSSKLQRFASPTMGATIMLIAIRFNAMNLQIALLHHQGFAIPS